MQDSSQTSVPPAYPRALRFTVTIAQLGEHYWEFTVHQGDECLATMEGIATYETAAKEAGDVVHNNGG